MKEPPLRKTSALQGGLPANRRVQEITVVQHYHPNPMRPKMGNFPEVHFNELPDGSRYLHLHPVFKFVDNFLSSTSVTSKSVPGGRQHIATKKRSPGKLVRNCECTPNDIVNNVGGDSVAKAFITKKSKMPHRTSNQNLLKNFKQERMKTNLSNMSSKSNIRVSLRGAPCMNWSRCGDNAPVHKNIEKTERSANSMGKGSEYYIEQLKNEIKESNSRTQFCRMTPRNDNYEYVDKLKDELSCTQSRCLEDARKIIDELKTEIVNYRLHAKTKYSSSCSDIASSEKALQSTIISGHKMGEYPPVERSEIYDKQGDVPHPSARGKRTSNYIMVFITTHC
jgi:hypothetical protein